METFENILDKYSCPKRTKFSSTVIEQIESIVKFSLPSDYKSYLEKYHAFEEHIGPEFVRLWDADEIIEMNTGYLIFENLPNTLGIGGNGGGEFIAIELTNSENYRIVLSPFIDLDKQYHIEIGTSFTDFLVRLENGNEWFDD